MNTYSKIITLLFLASCGNNKHDELNNKINIKHNISITVSINHIDMSPSYCGTLLTKALYSAQVLDKNKGNELGSEIIIFLECAREKFLTLDKNRKKFQVELEEINIGIDEISNNYTGYSDEKLDKMKKYKLISIK